MYICDYYYNLIGHMRYKCLRCGTELDAKIFVKCPRCGHRKVVPIYTYQYAQRPMGGE